VVQLLSASAFNCSPLKLNCNTKPKDQSYQRPAEFAFGPADFLLYLVSQTHSPSRLARVTLNEPVQARERPQQAGNDNELAD